MAKHRVRRCFQFGTLDLLILTTVVGVVGVLYRPADSLTSEAKLSTRLRRGFAHGTLGYQQALREATQEARRMALGRLWSEVEAELRREGLPIEGHENQYGSRHRALIAKEAWIGGDHTAHALFLEFDVHQRTTQQDPSATPGFVTGAYAGLQVEFNRPHADVLAGGAYPVGSALDRGLRLPETAEAVKSYPILKKAEITYDLIRYHRWDYWPYGFGLWLTFGDSASDDRRGQSMYLTAPSGLDSGEDWAGKPVRQNFVAEDTIGDFMRWGGSRWGQTD